MGDHEVLSLQTPGDTGTSQDGPVFGNDIP